MLGAPSLLTLSERTSKKGGGIWKGNICAPTNPPTDHHRPHTQYHFFSGRINNFLVSYPCCGLPSGLTITAPRLLGVLLAHTSVWNLCSFQGHRFSLEAEIATRDSFSVSLLACGRARKRSSWPNEEESSVLGKLLISVLSSQETPAREWGPQTQTPENWRHLLELDTAALCAHAPFIEPLLYGRLEWGWEGPMLSLHLDASSELGTRNTQQAPLHVAVAVRSVYFSSSQCWEILRVDHTMLMDAMLQNSFGRGHCSGKSGKIGKKDGRA